MAATTRRLLYYVSKRFSTAGVRRSYGGLPQSNSKSPPSSSQRLMELESEFSAHNYHPVPVVFSRANGSTIWDPEGKRYIDFLAAYSAVNQGHCHPKIMKALQEQVEKLTLSSRAFYNDKFPVFAERLTNMFGYDMVLPMNTGAEGVETALKLARKWGHEKKNIPKDEAIIVSCCGCFHGRTLAIVSMSCDNDATRGFGPLLPGNLKVDFGDADSLEKIFKEKGDRIAGFLFEPIQGEAGVIIPPDGYLKAVRELCTKYNVLMIADEVQSGLARSGKMLACDWEEIRPDMVILGKALGGGARLIYTAPFVAALFAIIYARYFSTSPTATLPIFKMTATTPTSSAPSEFPPDTKGDAGQSILMDQIVLFGDSITQGAWVPAGTGSTMAIAYQRKLDIMNRGLSGYNTAWALPVIKQWLPRSGERLPEIRMLAIWFGANDAALPTSPQHVTLEDFKKNLITIIDLVRSPISPYYSPSTVPVLITPPPVDSNVRNNELTSRDPPRVPDRDSEMTRQYAEAVKEVAVKEGVHFVDVWTAIDTKAREEGGLAKYLSDGLHLTGAGYEVVTTEIAKLIIEKLPELHWDKLPQIFPHWESCIPEAQRF